MSFKNLEVEGQRSLELLEGKPLKDKQELIR